jgi:hypothetical protein
VGQSLTLSEEEGFSQACDTIAKQDLYSQELKPKECSNQPNPQEGRRKKQQQAQPLAKKV